ncbi:MAG: RNA methyltransferase [Nitrospinae bacterium]|nr:RNA methyltransferase [Nitrospinota bacterium]
MVEGSNSNIHLAVVHFPVYNKTGEIVASSVTTLDVHDIARIGRTYGVGGFYVITPLQTQQRLVERIVEHWLSGFGARYNPTRKEALLKTRVKSLLADAVEDIAQTAGEKPKTIVTDAKQFPQSVGYERMREEVKTGGQFLLVFGTGWGLEESVVRGADHVLAPIEGVNGFNHLPVRAAIAIILDRLLAKREG